MREAGCLGGLLGLILGVVSAFCAALCVSQGNDILAGMILVVLIPVSGIFGLVIGIFALKWLKHTLDSAPNQSDRIRIVGFPSFIYSGLVIGLVSLTCWVRRPPSDEAMLAHFTKNRASFETLQQMARKDSRLERVDDTWTRPENPEKIGVSVERIHVYRQLMLKAGIPRGFNHYPHNPGIEFNYWLQGSAISNDYTKGFLYTSKPPKRLYKNLNTLSRTQNGFHHIEGNWYLSYEFIPG